MTSCPTPEGTRRPDVPARTIVLADGRAWGFALPSARLKPTIVTRMDRQGSPVVSVGIRTVMGYPPDIRRLREATRVAIEVGPEDERLATIFALAAALLLATHQITEEYAAALLDLGDSLSMFISDLLDIAFDLTAASARGPEVDVDV